MSAGDVIATDANTGIVAKEATGPCEVHAWETPGMLRRMLQAMGARSRGIDACRPCLTRAAADARKTREQGDA